MIQKGFVITVKKRCDMEIKEYKAFELDEVLSLYSAVGWKNYVERADILESAFSVSLCVLGAFDEEKLIGFIRAVGDGLTIVFIQDIIVSPEYQRRGIGKKLVETILEKYRGAYQIQLLTDNTEKTKAFYRSVGFYPSDELGCLSFVRMG